MPDGDPKPVPPAYTTCRVDGVEAFASGLFRGKPYTNGDLDLIVANFAKFSEKGLLKPVVVLGHEETQEFLDRTDLPSAGIVANVRREGSKLLLDFVDVPAAIAGLIRAKAYRKVSVELYGEDRPFCTDDGKEYAEPILRRVALLGGEIPQVKSLADLPVPVFDYAERKAPASRLVSRGFKRSSRGTYLAFSEIVMATLTRDELIKRLKASKRFAHCFADATGMDRAALEAKVLAVLPGLTPEMLAGFDDTQLMTLALGATAAPEAPKPAEMAEFDRPTIIAELVAAGEDATALEALSDDELKAKYLVLNPTATFRDKPKPAPVPATKDPTMAATFAEEKAKMKALHAQYEAEIKRADERRKAMRKTDVAMFCDKLVQEGRLLPAQRPMIEANLLEKDDVSPTHNFADGTKGTPYEAARRDYAAWPVVVKFGEKIASQGTATDELVEKAKVQRFADAQAGALKAAGKADIVHRFTEARKKKPTLTAAEYGVPAEYCV